MIENFTSARKLHLAIVIVFLSVTMSFAQTTISGNISDAKSGDPLVGVNIVVKGRVTGTVTDYQGDFRLSVDQSLPITLVLSYVGYQGQEVKVTSANVSSVNVQMTDDVMLGQEVVVSASRTEQSIMQSPVSIEKMGIMEVRNAPSDDYYKAIGNLKGVDVSNSSINFQILNSRGFGSTGNTRFVQLTDMMDTQAPALNFPIGNLNGPSKLDVESIEFIPGAASALYGPNAFNGLLLVTSKNPFEYQGLSAYVKYGMNHFGADEETGAPDTPQPMYEAAIRYAKSFNDKFAFKVNFSYMQAEDWYATNYSDKNAGQEGDLSFNPAYDGVHLYGDDGGLNLGLLRANTALRGQISGLLQSTFGMPQDQADQNAAFYVGSLPADNVNRTGYEERHLVDYGAENLKIGAGLNYRINDQLEASYTLNYGYGTSVYTGAQRYSLKNFNIQQHKLQLEADNFVVRGYTTIEESGDSYIADFTGFAVNNAYLDNATWFGTYGGTIAGGLIQQVFATNGSPQFDPAVVGAILSSPEARSGLHQAARGMADAGRYQPGTAGFNAATENINSNTIPNGSRFDDNTRFYQVDGMYDFKNQINAFELIVGGQWRQFDLRSNGTIFPDNEGDGIQINEYGAYAQAGKKLINDQLHLQASIRYDKNENFDGQFSPRVSAVYSANKNQVFRASYQTGFRNPTTQGQYIDLDVVSARLLGGLPQFYKQYGLKDFTYTFLSVEEFTNNFVNTGNIDTDLLVPFDFWEPVQPEKVQVFEVGYRGIFSEKLMVDLSYYRNTYNDFITQVRVRQVQNPVTGTPIPLNASPQAPLTLLSGDSDNTFQIYTNNDETVNSQGFAGGLEYLFDKGYSLSGNYSWNKLDEEDLSDDFINEYNTPEHIINVSFGNRNVVENFGFNLVYRWQSEFEWQSSFARGTVPSYSTMDAQVSYTFSELQTILKIGGSNIFNDYYIANYGSPQIGAIYYVSLTFDEMF